ncbi:hypothetical protein McanMca71_006730 [Microsporum canis]|uniref:Domain of unknown function at the cortex 1 domain-containing protein n=1 Tax=Arthroderma otae (strain ATCC MYA-4605 / CBS 113480) TaxID=554155 RepID=C5FFW4_ARTOC|nr:conserved hypothetical protein [Microsporum canis CBS 113480]EEQ29649.1 conserved hypothetical protein [Microsporum canis CBS 113480]
MASNGSGTQYRLQITAGPTYDTSTHRLVHVNTDTNLCIDTEHAKVNVCLRIQDYNGLPDSSPRTHAHFSHPSRQNDQYSLAISLIPKKAISGNDIVFGNDLDRPIRDRLPPGSSYAFRFIKWWVDPGLEGDIYADNPYIYGPCLSSWNYFRICGKEEEHEDNAADRERSDKISQLEIHETVVEEGAEGSGQAVRDRLQIPEDPSLRQKFFLDEQKRKDFKFEPGRIYKADFGNPYIGFSDFTIRIPGFPVPVTKYIDEKNHELRYILKNKANGDIYFVVLFTLLMQGEAQAELPKDESEPGESELD